MPNFKHINASEQIADGTIVTSLIADGAVTTPKININANLSFHENQALQMRLENVSSFPAAGNPGRLVWYTPTSQVYIDNGTSFVTLSANIGVSYIQADSNPPLTGGVEFVSGDNVVLQQTGNAITISSSGSGATTYERDLFVIASLPTTILTLSSTPVVNSETVVWNGVTLRPGAGNDYTISGNVITLSGSLVLTVNDTFMVSYSV